MFRQLFFALPLLTVISCTEEPSKASVNPDYIPEVNIEGVYKLTALQEQDDTIFVPYEGVTIYKFFSGNYWCSPAIHKKNSQVVNMAGGLYYYDKLTDSLTERLDYHIKDTLSVGELTKYRVQFIGDTLYQSGVYKKGTPDEWKVEEYWTRHY